MLAVVLGVDALLPAWLGQPVVGMAGAVLVISLTYRAARVRDRVPPQTLLLAGVALTYLFSAMILAVQYRATPADAARILRWLVGSLETAHGWAAPAIVGVAVALGLAALLPLGRAFNAMGGGEEAAAGVGVDVRRVVRRGYLAASLIVGVVVAFAGPIGFLGLIVPHTLRLIGLVDNRYLIPASALAGGGDALFAYVAVRWASVRPCLCFAWAEHVRRANDAAIVWTLVAALPLVAVIVSALRAGVGARLGSAAGVTGIVVAAITLAAPPVTSTLTPTLLVACIASSALVLGVGCLSSRAAGEHDRRRAEARLDREARTPVTF